MDVDVECEAGQLYTEANADTYSPPGPLRIARSLGLHVRRGPCLAAGGDAALIRLGGQPIIFVRRRLGPERFDFALAHEIAEWHLARLSYCEPDVEDVADALAAALVVPRDAYRAALRERGVAFGELARDFRATESCVALRLGEVTGRPLLLLAPRVRARGASFVWPSTAELRRIARTRRAEGLEVWGLGDDRRRIVLIAA